MIGDRCRIGAGAVIRGATAVASDVEIPAGASLVGCVVWPGASVPAGEGVAQAVIGRGGVIARVGSGL